MLEVSRIPANRSNALYLDGCARNMVDIADLYNGQLYREVEIEEIPIDLKADFAPILADLKVIGANYRIVEIALSDVSLHAVEILQSGSSDFSKYLRRTKNISGGVRYIVSPQLEYKEEFAAYFARTHWIVLGEGIMQYIRANDKDVWVPMMSHELRHARISYLRRRGEYLNYFSYLERKGNDGTGGLYDDYLSAEETYTFLQQARSQVGRLLRAIRKKDKLATVKMLDQLDSTTQFGIENTQRMIAAYAKARKAPVEVKKMSFTEGEYLAYEFDLGEEFFVVPFKKVDPAYELDTTMELAARLNLDNFLDQQVKVFESDIRYLRLIRDAGGF